MKTTCTLAVLSSFGALMAAQGAVIATIDPAGGEQDGIEFDTVTGAGTISRADMQAAVSGAAAGFSGVFDMSDMTGSNNGRIADTDDTTFAINGTGGVIRTAASRAEVLATSGVNHTWILGSTTLTFDLGSTGATGVTAFGFVQTAWRDGGGLVFDMDVMATFSDTSTASLNSDDIEAFLVGNPTPANGTYDKWYGFQAPTGETITSIQITEADPSGNWAAIDDAAFVLANPVPEPSSSALLGLGAIGLVLRRRR